MVADLVGLGHGDELGGGRALAEPAFQSRVAGGFAEMHRALDQPPLALDRLESHRVEIGNDQRAQLEKFEERRSEEHTSELQSLMRISYAVFCLKKKNDMTYRFYTLNDTYHT